MREHMLEHLALTLVLGPALAAGAAGRLRVRPWIGLVQFAAVVVVLHLPAVWDATHAHPLLRVAADAATVLSALLFWWPPLAPLSPLGPLGRAAYLMVGMPVMSAVGVVLDFVDRPLYSGVSVAEQHRAGALMWGVGSAAAAAIFVVAVWLSLLREERRAVEAAR